MDGEVIATADSKEAIYGKLLTEGREKNTAIEYCGEWPTDIAVMFCLPFSGPIDGLLGMDLLVALSARIDLSAAQIEIR